MRGEKWTLYEGGIRVPFIARWPGQVPVGSVDEVSVLNVCDLTPTMDPDGARLALYDLADDLSEKRDVALENRDAAERLKMRLLAWHQTLPD